MYELLIEISQRPEPFSRYTAKELWTRPYLAQQMLTYHLSQETDLASRRIEAIDQAVEWINAHLGLAEKKVCDLGCGPGLYTERFASIGAEVTGVDFSRHSLDFAETKGSQAIRYVEADYLSDDLPTGFDVVTLIYTDFCALSPVQRARLLSRMREMLNPGGHIVMDVVGVGSFSPKEETTIIEHKLMGGFWSPGDYVGIQRTFLYPAEQLALDHYLIIEPDENWQVYNWTQHFTPDRIETELRKAGFQISQMTGDLSGTPLEAESDLIGIVASA